MKAQESTQQRLDRILAMYTPGGTREQNRFELLCCEIDDLQTLIGLLNSRIQRLELALRHK